ncbi:ATP-binding protein [Dyella sp. A6]|uniref:sensor histidine kinase n=1 Tax=Dyella aluminiiresistens TaxID=3069105 RepID=UPI002E7A0287|nr:ATP-binding protein [Dyella sp. A6]
MAAPNANASFIVRLVRSSAFRLAALQASLFALVALALFTITWWSVRGYVESQVRHAIKDESAEILATPGSGLAAAVNEAVAQMPQGPFFYGLFSAHGQHLAGDLDHAPRVQGWSTMVQHESLHGDRDRHRRVLVQTLRLDDGRQLVVGRDRHSADELDELLQGSFLWAGIAAVLLALLGGVITARNYLGRVEAVAAAAARIAGGELETRVPLGERGDEFDRLAHSLNAMLERIQALMEGMRQVSNDIAHDLRTPLAHLRQRLEAATRDADSIDAFRAASERALADVDGVLATFAALLRIAQIESRQRRAGFAILDLSALLTSLAGDFAPVLEDQGRSLHTRIEPGLQVHGDRALLTQMVANLIENALRHTPAGTPVELVLERSGDSVRMVVADAGPGIPAAARAHVLGRFVRLDAARSTPGSGLGLALVAAVADLHGIALELGDARPGLRVQLDFPTKETM